MSFRVIPVEDRAALRRWVGLPYDLYRGVPSFVPQLRREQLAFFDARRNPSFQTSAARLFLAERDGEVVGRICGIVNSLETEKLGRKRGRFGWFESVDDQYVATALLDAVRDWLVDQQCVEMTGPHGFTDLDVEGLLVDGFDELPTISGSYNFPYYANLLETWGLTKDVDYLEFRAAAPDRLPLFEKLRKRYRDVDYEVRTCRSRKELKTYLPALWELLEESFEPLYGVVPLTAAQRDFYTQAYFDFLDPDFVKLLFNKDGGMVAFLLAMPSLSRALQRARGRLFPFGFAHVLGAFRKPETVDFLLAGAKPGEPTSILVAIGLIDMFDTLRARGVSFIETNHELEENTTVNQLWSKLELVSTRRSRVYRLGLA
ncbi:MAG: hypothetical protein JSV45_00670 [Chromatiales bacterium]|nr:MAG: hypothetical protein JSV45_00670 [Chromatiales bacterium]